jgi:hypothetical protein
VLAGIPGVSGVVVADGHLRCQLHGDVRPFLAAIAGSPVTDLTIEPARLEEAFLELYEDDVERTAGAVGAVAPGDVEL